MQNSNRPMAATGWLALGHLRTSYCYRTLARKKFTQTINIDICVIMVANER